MKRVTLVLVGLILAGLVIRLVVWPLVSTAENGKALTQEFIASSKHQCHWAGYLRLTKLDRTEVYVACTPNRDFPHTFATKDDFVAAVESQIVKPGIDTLSSDAKVSVVTIVQVSESMVLCTEVVEKRIRRSWVDTYDNYCAPP